MGDVQVKCTCTILEDSSAGCQTEVEIEMYFERRPEHPVDDPLGWRILTAPVCLCRGVHRLVWIPVCSDPRLSVWFTEFGPETLVAKPAKVDTGDWPPKEDPAKRWTVIINNQGVAEANGFHYDFCFNSNGNGNSSNKPLRSRDVMHYDPTIAVTPDPIEIPPKYRYPLATSGREESLEGGLGA